MFARSTYNSYTFFGELTPPFTHENHAMSKQHQPCTCGEDWAAHGLGDVIRLLTVGRATIKLHVSRQQLGIYRCGRIHLTAAEVAVVERCVRTAQRELQRRRLMAAGVVHVKGRHDAA